MRLYSLIMNGIANNSFVFHILDYITIFLTCFWVGYGERMLADS
jgi:hypothetical protein